MPVSGAWQLTFSLTSVVDSAETNFCYLYINGNQLGKTYHGTHSTNGKVDSTGGRVVTLEASTGDTIELKADRMDGKFWRINFCAEYMHSTGTKGNRTSKIYR